MSWQERIVVDPQILVGKPIIRGTRLSVELIVDLLAQGWSEADVLASYPKLTADDIHACLKYASAVMQSERVYPFHLGSPWPHGFSRRRAGKPELVSPPLRWVRTSPYDHDVQRRRVPQSRHPPRPL
jgi:uncharacterized protein (DUF433 family)